MAVLQIRREEMMMKKILVTPRSLTRDGDPALERLTRAGFEVIFSTPGNLPDKGELMALLPGCAGYLAGIEPISAEILAAAGGLKVISRNGSGVDNIDLEAAERLDIHICRAQGANAGGVAELTIGLIFALARSICLSDSNLKNDRWVRQKGFEVKGKTLGVVGCGAIGTRTAALATGMGMQVVGYDPFADGSIGVAGFQFVGLDELCRVADIITLHCPPLDSNRPIIDQNVLSKMKRGALLINTARASLIDLDAAKQALEAGQIAGLAVDVFEREPPEADALLCNGRVIATPHIGGYTAESVSRATIQAVENIIDVLKGR